MKKATILLIIFLATLASLASCSSNEPDGKWDKMKWKDLSGLSKENGVYIVPADGGTYAFECTNYSSPWLSGILDNGEYVYPHPGQEDVHSFTGDWFGVQCDHANVTITIQPLDGSTSSRSLNVGVTAGDIFDTFNFLQRQ
jgi:hypothetical protein